MPEPTRILPVSADLLRQAIDHTCSAIELLIAELEGAKPERWPRSLARIRCSAGAAREAAAVASDTLRALAGAPAPIPDLRPEAMPEGSARHQQPETEPTEPSGVTRA